MKAMRVSRMVIGLVLGLALVAGALGVLGDPVLMPVAQAATRGTLTVTEISRSGVELSWIAGDSNGHKFTNDGKTFVEVKNDSGDTITATFITPGTVDDLAISDLEVAVSDGAVYLVGPFPTNVYNQGSGSDSTKTYLDLSSTSSVSVAAFNLD